MSSDSIVFGAAGFIGRTLVAELLRRGNDVAAALRPGSAERLTGWLDEQGVERSQLVIVTCDITEPGLGMPPGGLQQVRDVYNSAAAFAWGLTAEKAQRVNVAGALNVLDWAAALPNLRRLIHITGYRAAMKDVAGQDKGGYESSKTEADTMLATRAAEMGIPLTIANPSCRTCVGPAWRDVLSPRCERRAHHRGEQSCGSYSTKSPFRSRSSPANVTRSPSPQTTR